MTRVLAEVAFVSLAAAVWSLLFGYPLSLLAARRSGPRPRRLADDELPAVTVIVATLDERERIEARLDDIARTDYPSGKLRAIVVDGGSTDGTVERVRPRTGPRLRLLEVAGRRGKAAQVAAAIDACDDPVVVISDADARLAPDCIRKLVETLAADPRAAIVGARIVPETALAEERLHWALVGKLSWLEGEVLGAATPSGVALALRRGAVELGPGAVCDDVHLAVAAGQRGQRVKLCWDSVAVESRTSATRAGMLALRRRRGRAFRHELVRAVPLAEANVGFRLARSVRLLMFDVVPWAIVALGVLGGGLAAAGERRLPAAAALAFALPLFGFAAAAVERRAAPQPLAPLRWAAISLLALVTLRWRLSAPGEAL